MAEDDFAEMFNTTVVMSTAGPVSRSLYGVETYSTAGGSTFDARYVQKAGEIRKNNGEVIAQSGILWINSTVAFSTKAKAYVTQVSRAYPVAMVESFPDENGQHHVKLRLGH